MSAECRFGLCMCRLCLALLVLAVLPACSSHKDIAYLQEQEGALRAAADSLYDARIKPKDLLTITVNTFDREASLPFNLMYPSNSPNGFSNNVGENIMQKYLVDNDGEIDFPVLGRPTSATYPVFPVRTVSSIILHSKSVHGFSTIQS